MPNCPRPTPHRGHIHVLRLCVSTAERVNLVASLDLPPSGASYAHRVGRTGRFGTAGVAVAFVTAAELPALRRLLADVPGAQACCSATLPYPKPFLQPSCCALDGSQLRAERDLQCVTPWLRAGRAWLHCKCISARARLCRLLRGAPCMQARKASTALG